MKYFTFIQRLSLLLALFCLLPDYARALSDEDYKHMMSVSEKFRKADKELSDLWKNLMKHSSKDLKKILIDEQRQWLNTDRDNDAKEFMEVGFDKTGAYTKATIKRIHILRATEYNNNLSKEQQALGAVKDDMFFLEEDDYPEYYKKK